MGLLTERAAHTLRFYLLETSPPVCKWWDLYIKAHRIPLTGEWHEVSGDEFIRELMRTPDVEYGACRPRRARGRGRSEGTRRCRCAPARLRALAVALTRVRARRPFQQR